MSTKLKAILRRLVVEGESHFQNNYRQGALESYEAMVGIKVTEPAQQEGMHAHDLRATFPFHKFMDLRDIILSPISTRDIREEALAAYEVANGIRCNVLITATGKDNLVLSHEKWERVAKIMYPDGKLEPLRKIEGVRVLRELTEMGLKDAIDYVDALPSMINEVRYEPSDKDDKKDDDETTSRFQVI